MSTGSLVKSEYYLEEINFDEYSRGKIDTSFKQINSILSLYGINLREDNQVDKLKFISKVGLDAIKSFEKEVDQLNFHYPKLRYSYEFHSLKSILAKVDFFLDYCESATIRSNTEIQKIYVKEKELSLIVPFSELKKTFDEILISFSYQDYSNMDYEFFFVQSLLSWIIIKGKVDINSSQSIMFESMKSFNISVFNWSISKLFLKDILNNFDIVVPQGKDYCKVLVKRSDTLGKKMNIGPTDFILFEASLGDLTSARYINGKKFRYPDETGQTYVASSKYVIVKKWINVPLLPMKLDFKFPVYIGMLKSKGINKI